MKTNITVLFLAICTLFGCNGNKDNKVNVSPEGNVALEKSIIEGVDLDQVLINKAPLMADMSNLVPVEEIATALNIDPSKITKVPNQAANTNTCFFKWDDPNFPNTGIMMQMKTNPYPDELPEWAVVTMSGLRQDGETALGEDFNHRYKELRGMASEGLYNADLGKYYWRFSDKVVMFLAFNTIHEQQEQFEIATEIGTKMIKNYLDIE